MGQEAWGRWGPDDEIGAPNTIGPAEIVGAAALVRRGRALSLAPPLSSRTPHSAHRAPLGHFLNRDGGDYAAGARRPDGFQFAEDTVILPTHSGAHLDGLAHVWYDDKLYNGFSSATIRSTAGAARCGIDKCPPIVSRGVLIDLVAYLGRSLSLGETVTAAVVEGALADADLALRAGDSVLLRTGWIEDTERSSEEYFSGEPGIDVDAAVWLARHDVAIIGSDNYAIEVQPTQSGHGTFPVHQRLLRDFGIPLLEGLTLRGVADLGVSTFLLVVAPLPLVGGTASPVNPVAVC